MDSKEFREGGRKVIDYIIEYLETVSQRRVTPSVCPGYLIPLLPSTAPETRESLNKIMEDFDMYIMPGLTHWQHSEFHAYLTSSSSLSSTIASMLSHFIGRCGFNWINILGFELEKTVINWLGKMMDLPDSFLNHSAQSRAGGIIQSSGSECILISLLTARNRALRRFANQNPTLSEAVMLCSLVAYCSNVSYSGIKKNALITLVTLRILDTDDEFRLRGETLAKSIKEDIDIGLIPFFVTITLGYANCGSCDPIDEIGAICDQYGIWLNVDASYAGAAMICPEYRKFLKGIEYASSFVVNASKWMLVNLSCAVLIVKDIAAITESMALDRTLFDYTFSEQPEKLSSNRDFDAFKIWIVLRSYGIEGLQSHIRNHIRLAKLFEEYVKKDERFEVIACQFGIVCFRLNGSDALNLSLLKAINSSGKLHMIHCDLRGKTVIRFVICVENASEDDITRAWGIICENTDKLLNDCEKNELVASNTGKEHFKHLLP